MWKLAGTLGVGILLISDSSLMSIMFVPQLAHFVAQLTQIFRCNNSFTNDQINALATLAFNTRPGCQAPFTSSIHRRVWKMVAYVAQVSLVMVEGFVALATWRRSREVNMERCEGTISLGSLQSFMEDAMRKSFIP